jgi:hypothetical protein
MFEWLSNLFNMSEMIEDEEEEQQKQQDGAEFIDDEEEPVAEPTEPKASSKSGLSKAKKPTKPRVTRPEYKGQPVQLSSEAPVPIDMQNKGTRRVARTMTAVFATGGKGKLTVTVKKGRGTKDYEYNLVAKEDLLERIKHEMAQAKVNTLDEVRLAVHFPELYWNAAYAFERSTNKIAQMLQEGGIPSGQRRRRGK